MVTLRPSSSTLAFPAVRNAAGCQHDCDLRHEQRLCRQRLVRSAVRDASSGGRIVKDTSALHAGAMDVCGVDRISMISFHLFFVAADRRS